MLIKVTYDLADPAGIMYFANVYPLAHKNIEHWLEDDHKLWDTWFNNKDYGAPIKHSQCEYFKPMIAGKDYDIKSSVKKIGTSSITLTTNFSDKKNELCAQVETVHVFVDKKTMTKTDIPSKILAQLSV